MLNGLPYYRVGLDDEVRPGVVVETMFVMCQDGAKCTVEPCPHLMAEGPFVEAGRETLRKYLSHAQVIVNNLLSLMHSVDDKKVPGNRDTVPK